MDRGRLGKPVEERPDVVLEDGALEGIRDQRFRARAEELIEQSNSLLVRRPGQQVAGLAPAQRIDRVEPVLLAVGSYSNVEMAMQPVPQVIRSAS